MNGIPNLSLTLAVMSRNSPPLSAQEYYTSIPKAFFVHFFVWSHRSASCLHVSHHRRYAFMFHATGNISWRAQYFPASRVNPFSLFLPLSLSLFHSLSFPDGMCQRWWYMAKPASHVVMLSEACDISCHASRTL